MLAHNQPNKPKKRTQVIVMARYQLGQGKKIQNKIWGGLGNDARIKIESK